MVIEELVFWGTFCMMTEISFTALRKLIQKRNLNLMGHTSLWMFPIYAVGLTYGFDLVMHLIDNTTARYMSYPLWIWLVEICVGVPAFWCGIKIWDYTYLPKWLHWRGIISFAHYPLWMGFGILVEAIK